MPEGAETIAAIAVKNVELIAKSEDMMARIYTLAPGEEIRWHVHSAVTDWHFCLEGLLRVRTRKPETEEVLEAGGMAAVPAGRAHCLANAGQADCRFLLLQGVGPFDIHFLEPAG